MFNSLRQGSTLYVMDKGNLTLKVGSVESVSQPTGMASMAWMQPMPGQTMDVTVKYDDGTTNEFKQLQPSMAMAVYGNVVVAETREMMAQEVENMTRQSKSVLESMDYHQSVLKACEEMMKRLSPAYAKEKETDQRLTAVEQGLGDIKSMLAEALKKTK